MIQQIAEIIAPNEQVHKVALALLQPSKTQPRRFFEPKAMQEMVESVRAHGIIQPLIVRPAACLGLPGDQLSGISYQAEQPLEIVAGERRSRAAAEVGLGSVPVLIRLLTDEEAIEQQLIENLERADLTKLEEAEHFSRMLSLRDAAAQPRYTVPLIAARINRSEAHINGRLKLLKLPAAGKKALASGELHVRIAQEIGRVPTAAMREKALGEILSPQFEKGPLTFLKAMEVIRRYKRQLKGAPFDLADATLVPEITDAAEGRIGGLDCLSCPMRTGNAAEIFGPASGGEGRSGSRGDLCTNPGCFELKCDAHWARLHGEDGRRLLTGEEARAVFDADGRVRFDCEYVDIAQQPARELVRKDVKELPTWRALLNGLPDEQTVQVRSEDQATGAVTMVPVTRPFEKPPLIMARDPRGRQRELVVQALAIAAVNLAAEVRAAQAPGGGEPSIFDLSTGRARGGSLGFVNLPAESDAAKGEKQRLEKEEQRVAFEIKLAAMGELVGEMERNGGAVPGFKDALIDLALIHAGHDGRWFVARRRGVDDNEDLLRDYGYRLTDLHKLAFVIELLLGKAFKSFGTEDKSFRDFAARYELDLAAIERAVRSPAEANSNVEPAEKLEALSSKAEAPETPVAPAVAREHAWELLEGNRYRCGCGAAAVKSADGPYVVAHEFRGKPCSREVRTCSRSHCKNDADEGFKMCGHCREQVRLNQKQKRAEGRA